MTDSLRDQLIKAGFKPNAKPKAKPAGKPGKKPRRGRKPGRGGAGRGGGQASGSDISLAKAYELREQQERNREAERKRAKQREDAIRRKQNEQLEKLLEGRVLNDPGAEIARHFQDGERITRIYVTEQQRDDLARDRLGIIKLRRRYVLVDRSTLDEAVRIKPDCAIDLGNEAEAD